MSTSHHFVPGGLQVSDVNETGEIIQFEAILVVAAEQKAGIDEHNLIVARERVVEERFRESEMGVVFKG